MLRIKLTRMQLVALQVVWSRLLQVPPPNCGQLLAAAGSGWGSSRLIGYLDRLAAKDVLRWWRQGNARLWAPGPMADHFQEEGLLP